MDNLARVPSRLSPRPAPSNAPLRAPGDAPPRAPGNAPLRAPGKAPLRAPGNAPLRAPGNAPLRAARGRYALAGSLRAGRASWLLVLALSSAGVLVAGCGSSTKTSETTTPPTAIAPATSTAAGQTTTSASGRSGTTAPAPTAGTGGTPAASTRTARAPGFVHEEAASAQLASAVAVLKEHGYAPNDTSQYHASQTLRVLVGTRSPTGDGYGQQAFFFIGGHYIGTDTTQPSATIAVVSQSDTEVTLAYPRYRPGDPLCCAHGGEARVRFALNNGHLAPLGPIPPESVRR